MLVGLAPTVTSAPRALPLCALIAGWVRGRGSVSQLLVDRAFTATMTDPRTCAIVTSTLQLAHALDLVLVAEGVEDQATLDALTRLGCDVVQGFHLSPPLPPDLLDAWLDARSRPAVLPAA